MQALIEMCAGNSANQKVILDKRAVESINQVLKLTIDLKADHTCNQQFMLDTTDTIMVHL